MAINKPKGFRDKSKCQFYLSELELAGGYQCPFDRFRSDVPFCIFHALKPGNEGYKVGPINDAKQIEKEFQRRLSELITESETNGALFVDFRGFNFPDFEFSERPIRIKVNFSYAKFLHDVSFSFHIEGDELVQELGTRTPFYLQSDADFRHVEFKGYAFFEGCETDAKLDFGSAVFTGPAHLAGVNFRGETSFEGAVFKDLADFQHSNFGRVVFAGARFEKEAEFWGVRVSDLATFETARFANEANFIEVGFGTKYNEPDEFVPGSERLLSVSFYEAEFANRANFLRAHFYGPATFYGAVFNQRTVFDGYKSDMFPWGCDFRGVTLPKDYDLVFEKIHLGRTRFNDTNLEKIVFRDVDWGRTDNLIKRLFRGGFFILWDEGRAELDRTIEHDVAKTVENYRQLVLNFEAKRDYESAEYFHIGEMEMSRRRIGRREGQLKFEKLPYIGALWRGLRLRRVASTWWRLRKFANSYSLYWFSSRYGTSFVQALVVLLLLALMISYLFLLAGFRGSKENAEGTERIIEYNLIPGEEAPVPPAVKTLSDFGEALSYTLSIVTFQKDRFYEPISWHSRYCLYLAVILLTGQSAMVLLAIRRRFKR